MALKGNSLKNYLRAKRRQRRQENTSKYVMKKEDNIIQLSTLLLYQEAAADKAELIKSNSNYDAGDVIDMCKLCSDDAFHVHYVYDDMKDDNERRDEQLRNKICDSLVEELVNLSNMPEDSVEVYYFPDDDEYDDMVQEHYEYIAMLDRKIRFVRGLIFTCAVSFLGLCGYILYNLLT